MKSLLLTAFLCSLSIATLNGSESRSGSGKLPIEKQRAKEKNFDLSKSESLKKQQKDGQARDKARRQKNARLANHDLDNWPELTLQ